MNRNSNYVGWQNPEGRAKGIATKRANRIKALGTTEERMAAPPLGLKERGPILMGYFRSGMTIPEVVALHPTTSYDSIHRHWMKWQVEKFNLLGDLL